MYSSRIQTTWALQHIFKQAMSLTKHTKKCRTGSIAKEFRKYGKYFDQIPIEKFRRGICKEDIVEFCNISSSTARDVIKALKDFEWVTTRKEGKRAFFVIHEELCTKCKYYFDDNDPCTNQERQVCKSCEEAEKKSQNSTVEVHISPGSIPQESRK